MSRFHMEVHIATAAAPYRLNPIAHYCFGVVDTHSNNIENNNKQQQRIGKFYWIYFFSFVHIYFRAWVRRFEQKLQQQQHLRQARQQRQPEKVVFYLLSLVFYMVLLFAGSCSCCDDDDDENDV